MIYIGSPAGVDSADQEEARFVATLPTSLIKLTEADFDRIAIHGERLTRLP
jgi:hypothetical protein